jgi:hypothetical protein
MQMLRGPFLTIFRATAGLTPFVLTLFVRSLFVLCATTASAQTIYKWVDEHGVVNYGNADVPKSREVKVVDTTPPVAAQPGAKAREAAAHPARLSDADMLREELLRSREEVSRLRQNASVSKNGAGHPPEGFAAWRDACEKQHRDDCSEAAFIADNPSVVNQPVSYSKPAAPDPGLQVAGSGKPAPRTSATNPITTMQ